MISKYLTDSIPPPRRSPRGDPQRSKLYKMEREFIGSSVNHVVSRKNLQDVANHISNYYKIPKTGIVVINEPSTRYFGWAMIDGTIYLNRGFHGANLATLLHEMSHVICDAFYGVGNHVQHHGPEFVAIYRHLLSKYRLLPKGGFDTLADKWRIEIGTKYKPSDLKRIKHAERKAVVLPK